MGMKLLVEKIVTGFLPGLLKGQMTGVTSSSMLIGTRLYLEWKHHLHPARLTIENFDDDSSMNFGSFWFLWGEVQHSFIYGLSTSRTGHFAHWYCIWLWILESRASLEDDTAVKRLLNLRSSEPQGSFLHALSLQPWISGCCIWYKKFDHVLVIMLGLYSLWRVCWTLKMVSFVDLT